MNHRLLIGTLKWMWSDYAFNLLSQTEWHQLRHGQLHSTSKSDAKVDTKHFSICGVDEEVFKMAVTNSNQVRSYRESGH